MHDNNNAYYHATFTPPHATLCPTFLEDRWVACVSAPPERPGVELGKPDEPDLGGGAGKGIFLRSSRIFCVLSVFLMNQPA